MVVSKSGSPDPVPKTRAQIRIFFITSLLRDRPFNLKGGGGGGGLWFFVSFRIFFSDNIRVRIFIFFVALSGNFFSRL